MNTRRIQMHHNVPFEDVITSEGRHLGRFIPGHTYWVTYQNLPTVEKVLRDGRAKEIIDPGGIITSPGCIAGSVEIK